MTTGGSGFGVMAIIAAVSRGWIGREPAAERLLTMVRFLYRADSYHGILPHFLHGDTGRTIPFSRKDDGGDLVETAFLLAGLLCAASTSTGTMTGKTQLRARSNQLWEEAEWSWYTPGASNVLYWHWSPNHGWSMNAEIRGWNQCLLTYVLAASAPRYPIDSFLGLDPRGLKDRYADYWEQNVNHALINREHCIRNSKGFKGYGQDCWGLTSSDDHQGYGGHAPDRDLGVITPSAALSSFPHTPAHSMRALRYFYQTLRERIWSEYGFVDAFSEAHDWYAQSHLAIDQGPIVVMIENYRTGLLWDLFMSCPEIEHGLRRLSFTRADQKNVRIASVTV